MRAFAAAVQLARQPGPLTPESVRTNTSRAADWVRRCVAVSSSGDVLGVYRTTHPSGSELRGRGGGVTPGRLLARYRDLLVAPGATRYTLGGDEAGPPRSAHTVDAAGARAAGGAGS